MTELTGTALDDAIRRAAAVIAAGGVVAFPTDTYYGLAADPRSETALRRLFELKGRPQDRTVPLIAADTAQVTAIAHVSPLAATLAGAFWPGPLTLVLEARDGLAAAALHGGRVAVRVPDHAVARALALAVGHPVTATSANRSGAPPSGDPRRVERDVPGVDLFLDAGAAPGGSASTIVDASGTAPRLLRAGAIEWPRVLESLGSAPSAP